MRSRLDLFTRSMLFYLVVAFVALAFFGHAFAQVDPAANPDGFFTQLWDAFAGHKWALAVVLVTIALVAFLRWLAPRLHDGLGAFLNSNRGGALLALVMAALASVAGTLMTGAKITPALIKTAIGIGVAAIGGYNAFWDLFFPADAQKNKAGATTSTPTPPIVKAAALLLLGKKIFIGTLVFLAGCACSLPQNVMNPGCRVLSVIIACLPSALVQGATALISAVTPAITGGTIDWGALGTLEKSYGTNAVMCAVQQALQLAQSTSAPQNSALAPAAQQLMANKANVEKNVKEIFAKRRVVVVNNATSMVEAYTRFADAQ